MSLQIDTLIDVRFAPVSRRRGFSKSALAQLLDSRGINYIHLKDLGAPKELRELLEGMGDYDLFFSQYRHHAETKTEALQTVVTFAESQNVALMCLESDPGECHRHVLAEIVQRGWPQIAIKVC